MTDKYYNNEHFSPDYIKDNPIILIIKSIDSLDSKKQFENLTSGELIQGSVKLTQTLCSESYFIWGGFNASRLAFECYSKEFVNKAPSGKIQFTITPTVYENGKLKEVLSAEETALFTGYIEEATPGKGDGHWSVTAYDRLYRVRNNEVVNWLQRFINGHKNEGSHLSWYQVERAIASSQLGLPEKGTLPEWTKTIYYPDNVEITSENGVDLLRDFALCSQRFGILNGEGALEYVEVQDSNTGAECYRINDFNPEKFSTSSGHVWLPRYFTSEPLTNIFYSTGETTSEDDYYNNYYALNNIPCIGNQDWINSLYECDEYGTQSSKYSAANLPAGLFDTGRMCLTSGQEFYCQEYKIKVRSDPTIPMGSIIHIVKKGELIVKSYLMERTINFTCSQVIECEMSAHNAPYNECVSELDYGVRSANVLANETSAKMPFISDGSSLTKLRAHKVLSKSDYAALKEKRADTIYYVYDDSTS